MEEVSLNFHNIVPCLCVILFDGNFPIGLNSVLPYVKEFRCVYQKELTKKLRFVIFGVCGLLELKSMFAQ